MIADYEWTAQAPCADDPDAMFVEGAAQQMAKRRCAGCPVKARCLAEALDHGLDWGVWGGLTERERRALRRRHPRVTDWRRFLDGLDRPAGPATTRLLPQRPPQRLSA